MFKNRKIAVSFALPSYASTPVGMYISISSEVLFYALTFRLVARMAGDILSERMDSLITASSDFN